MGNKTFYITTPIYYVNDSPHIGHAYTTIACDVMARFMQLDGYEVKFLTGTDEHGQKVDKAANSAGIDPQAFTDEVSQRFRYLVYDPLRDDEDGGDNLLNVTNTDFVRTTEERHKRAAQALWRRLEENGHIYLDKYCGWYSVRDEAYYQESELTEIDDKKVAPSGAEVEWVEEESYFFRLSAFADRLLDLYDNNNGRGGDFVVPKSRLNEVRSFVKGGLRDLSVSRTNFRWGVPVPGDDRHVMYVWIDALTNYLTSTSFPDMEAEGYRKFWADPQSNGGVIHMVGKDILRFHAVYWPAFLMGADLPLPKRVIAHGWWTIEGEKMSKSLGNVLSPEHMIERAGGVDQLRYFMLRAMPFGNDGDFSQEALIDIINADLANNIGNLAQRVLSMIYKNCNGLVPEANGEVKECDKKLLEAVQVTMEETPGNARDNILNGRFELLLKGIVEAASRANEYIDEQQPWTLKKDPKMHARMRSVLYYLAEAVRCIAIMMQPFTPDAACRILDQLCVARNERSFRYLLAEHSLHPGAKLPKPEGVFPRLDKKGKGEAA